MNSSLSPSHSSPEIQVVAAAVWNGVDRILIAEKKLGAVGGLSWEFPGGKVELGESFEQALSREILEEIQIEIDTISLLGETTFQNRGKSYRLHLFFARWIKGIPTAVEHNKIHWTKTFALSDLNWSSADIPFLEPVAESLRRESQKN